MSLVVMKFGGTSVEDPAAIRRTAAIVAGRVAARQAAGRSRQRHVQGHRLAAARRRRREKATVKERLAVSAQLRQRHRETAAALVKDSAAPPN